MSNQEINNALILLRKYAEQSRVHIIKKLTREADRYRKKKGTETQKAKNDRKSKRIVAEILSIKNVKKDEITKFALRNTETLKEVLENQNSKPYTRILTRICNHKIFNEKISNFKLKYPNYMNFLESKKKNKANIKQKNLDNNLDNISSTCKLEIQDHEISDNSNSEINNGTDESNETLINSNTECTEKGKMNSVEITLNTVNSKDVQKIRNASETEQINSIEEKTVATKFIIPNNTKLFKKSLNKKNSIKVDQMEKNENYLKSKTEKSILTTVKIINKQTVVKKFKDLLQDETCHEDNLSDISHNPIESNIEIKKEVDPFFVTEDGELNYLTLALPENNSTNQNSFDNIQRNKFNNPKFSQPLHGKRIDNIDKKSFKFSLNESISKWKDQHKKAKLYDKRNKSIPSFKKCNDHTNKSVSNKKERSKNLKDKTTEILHPSWEAKRKQQHILQQGFQGKKIVFDD